MAGIKYGVSPKGDTPFLLLAVLGLVLVLVGVLIAAVLVLILVLIVHSSIPPVSDTAVFRNHSIPVFSGFILGPEEQTRQ